LRRRHYPTSLYRLSLLVNDPKEDNHAKVFFYNAATALIALWSAATTVQAVELDLSDPSNKLDSIVTLPIKSLKAVEANGEIMFMSENGRFVLRGQLYDIWYKDSIDTPAEIEDAATRIHFKRMAANLDDYNTLTIGTGKEEVVAFVDPLCSICHKLMKDAQGLGLKYTFKFIVVPALGDESNKLARRVFCAANRKDALHAFMSKTLETLEQKKTCDTKQYDMTLMMAHLLDIQAVPFVVAPDGRPSLGRPSNLKQWLEAKS
jgi:thiol:disulfide interchange protein DsbC